MEVIIIDDQKNQLILCVYVPTPLTPDDHLYFIGDTNDRFIAFFPGGLFIECSIQNNHSKVEIQTAKVLNIEKELTSKFGVGPSATYVCSNDVMCVFEHGYRGSTSQRCLYIMQLPNIELKWTCIPLDDTCVPSQRHTHLHGRQLLRVEKRQIGEGIQTRIRFWPEIDFHEDEQHRYILLEGTVGCFSCNGTSIVTWSGQDNGDDSQYTIYLYHTRHLHHRSLDALDTVEPPHEVFQLSGGMVLRYAQLVMWKRSGDDGGIDRKLVVLCDVPWTSNAKIFVIDVQEGTYEAEIDSGWSYKDGSNIQSWVPGDVPFVLSPDGRWMHYRHQRAPLGTICCLEHPNSSYDINHDVRVGTMEPSFTFDPTGRMLSAQLEGGLLICEPPQLQSDKGPQKWPVNTDDCAFRALEFIRRYDPALYDRFLSNDLSQSDILQSPLFTWLMSETTLALFTDAIEELGEERVKHVVFSEEMLAIVLCGDPVEVLFWNINDIKDTNRLTIDQCLYRWEGMQPVDADPLSSMAVFCPRPEYQQDFVLIQKDAHGVYLRWLETERFQTMAVKRLWMKDVNRFRRIWVTHSGKLHILQSDGEAHGYDLTDRSECESLSASDGTHVDLLREATMDWNFIHEERGGYVLGWDFTKNRLMTSSTVALDRRNQEIGASGDIGHVLWRNATRALVAPSSQIFNGVHVVVFDISGARSEKIAEITSEGLLDVDVHRRSSFQGMKPTIGSQDPEKFRAFIGRLLYAWRVVLPNPQHLYILGIQQTSHLLNRFVKNFKGNLVNARAPGDRSMTLLHQAIIHEDTASTQLLWNLAHEHALSVDVDWGDSDVLHWAMQQQRQRCTDVAFEKLLSSNCSVMDTARLFKTHIRNLIDNCRIVLESAVLSDVLSHSFGIFSVPIGVFERSSFGTVIETCSHAFRWKSSGDTETAWFWKRMRRQSPLASASGTQILAESKFIPIEDVAQVGMRGILRPLLMGHVSIELFATDLVKWIIEYKWENCWRGKFQKAMLLYALLIISFSCYACIMARLDQNFEGDLWAHVVSLMALSVSYIISLFDALGEVRQLKRYSRDRHQGWKYYFSLPWNWIELTSEFLILILIPSLHVAALMHHDNDIAIRVYGVSAFECIILWFKVLYYAQPFQSTGPLVAMIRKIMYDIMVFLALSCIVLIGFSFGFYVLFQNINDPPESFATLQSSLETLFYAMLGDFDKEVYHLAGHLSWLATTWFIVYMIIQAIVFLNLLIAIMGDTYDRVKLTEGAELMKCRAIVIDDGEAAMTDREIIEMEGRIGKYIHVLMPLDKHAVSNAGDGVWQGRIHAMECRIRDAMAEREGRVMKMMTEVLQQNAGLRAELMQMKYQNVESTQRIAEENHRLFRQMEELKTVMGQD